MKLPKDNALPVNRVIAPYVFVGDDAFALKKFMTKPYPQQNLTTDNIVYNYNHNRTKRISENLFGNISKQVKNFLDNNKFRAKTY